MAARKRGLGKGLEALLGASALTHVTQVGQDVGGEGSSDGTLRNLAVDLIQCGRYQPRTGMNQESLEELAESIRAQGLVQPIVVRPLGDDRYEIIAGERRWRAVQIAGLHDIPAVIRDVPDNAAIAMALIENIQREALNPMEEANALQRLIEEFGMTHQQAAQAVGRSRAAVTNLLRLRLLNADVKALVENGALDMGHARTLLAIEGETQSRAACQVVEQGLSVRETERLVKRLLEQPVAEKGSGPQADPHTQRLEEQLSERLGARVTIQHGRHGKGKLVVQYHSLDELDGILEHIR